MQTVAAAFPSWIIKSDLPLKSCGAWVAVRRIPGREKLCYFSVPVGHTQSVLAYLLPLGS